MRTKAGGPRFDWAPELRWQSESGTEGIYLVLTTRDPETPRRFSRSAEFPTVRCRPPHPNSLLTRSCSYGVKLWTATLASMRYCLILDGAALDMTHRTEEPANCHAYQGSEGCVRWRWETSGRCAFNFEGIISTTGPATYSAWTAGIEPGWEPDPRMQFCPRTSPPPFHRISLMRVVR